MRFDIQGTVLGTAQYFFLRTTETFSGILGVEPNINVELKQIKISRISDACVILPDMMC